MSNAPSFLKRLALDDTADERTIRRAYARELKLIDQEQEAAAFQVLRTAYEQALHWVRQSKNRASFTPQFVVTALQEENDAVVLAAEHIPDFSIQRTPVTMVRKSDAREQPHDIAQEVFSEFKIDCASLAARSAVHDIAPWLDLVQRFLSDARLDNMLTRELFEQQVAFFLIQGWKPGHESLFAAAGALFNWQEDRRRTTGLGVAGQHINQAFEEYAVFNQPSRKEFNAQQALLARLRDAKLPSRRELLRKMPAVTGMIQHYPALIPMITSRDHIQHWHALDKEIPAWRRKLAFQRHSRPGTRRRTFSTRGWIWIGIVAFSGILRLFEGFDTASSKHVSSPYLQNLNLDRDIPLPATHLPDDCPGRHIPDPSRCTDSSGK